MTVVQLRNQAQPPKPETRFEGVERPYSREDVERLRGSLHIEHSLARAGAERLWKLMTRERKFVRALGALTGNQAVQMVRGGLDAIYCSGWQVAADANPSGMYPDQSLYQSNGVPKLVERINNSLMRADQIDHAEGKTDKHWYAPIVADAEAGYGGPLNAFELMKQMIAAGAAGVHFEDQLSSAKKCGHLGGKVLVPTSQFIRTLTAARLAADVCDVPTVIIARTDANSAQLLTSDVDEVDREFIASPERTEEGFFRIRGGLDCAIARGLAYAPYCDMIWCETSTPDLDEARQFAEAIHAKYPNKMLAYNCSPSFNWKKKLDDEVIAKFQEELGNMGYAFQFVTLAGYHALSHVTFELARGYAERGMSAYSALQESEFASAEHGYTAVKHQHEVGTGYFDDVANTIAAGRASTLALEGSTEAQQF